MKILHASLFLLLMAITSCKDPSTIYIKHFSDNTTLFKDVVKFLEENPEGSGFSETDGHFAFFDSVRLSNPRYVSPIKEQLAVFFAGKKFKKISCYPPNEIQFLLEFKKNNLVLSETKISIIYLKSDTLTFPRYGKPPIKIEKHWYYLEQTDSQY